MTEVEAGLWGGTVCRWGARWRLLTTPPSSLLFGLPGRCVFQIQIGVERNVDSRWFLFASVGGTLETRVKWQWSRLRKCQGVVVLWGMRGCSRIWNTSMQVLQHCAQEELLQCVYICTRGCVFALVLVFHSLPGLLHVQNHICLFYWCRLSMRVCTMLVH